MTICMPVRNLLPPYIGMEEESKDHQAIYFYVQDVKRTVLAGEYSCGGQTKVMWRSN